MVYIVDSNQRLCYSNLPKLRLIDLMTSFWWKHHLLSPRERHTSGHLPHWSPFCHICQEHQQQVVHGAHTVPVRICQRRPPALVKPARILPNVSRLANSDLVGTGGHLANRERLPSLASQVGFQPGAVGGVRVVVGSPVVRCFEPRISPGGVGYRRPPMDGFPVWGGRFGGNDLEGS